MGIELNIQTWNLLDKVDRDENDDRRMLFFAKASLYHWQKSPHFKPVNEQRGEWLISRIYAVLNQGEKSLEHANTCMDITDEESLKDFDLAYAYECKARAFASLGDSEKMNSYFVILFSWHIASELKKNLKKKGFKGKFIIPLPYPKIES